MLFEAHTGGGQGVGRDTNSAGRESRKQEPVRAIEAAREPIPRTQPSSRFPSYKTFLDRNCLCNFPCICTVSLPRFHFLWARTIHFTFPKLLNGIQGVLKLCTEVSDLGLGSVLTNYKPEQVISLL